jgi:hypothetical protein
MQVTSKELHPPKSHLYSRMSKGLTVGVLLTVRNVTVRVLVMLDIYLLV